MKITIKSIFPVPSAILAGVLAVLLLGAPPAYSYVFGGNPDDTPAGTLITSEAETNTLEYTDVNTNPKSTEESDTITTSVEAVWGLAWAVDNNDTHRYTTPGVTLEWMITFESGGNAPISFTMTKEVAYGGGTDGTDWIVGYFHATDESEYTGNTIALDEDDYSDPLIIRIKPSSIEANSPDGSYALITTYVNPLGDHPQPGVQLFFDVFPYYEYARGTVGGGYALGGLTVTYSSDLTGEVQAPLLTLTRVSTVDAPTAYTGASHDVVPGSLITYMLHYANIGAGSASDVVIIDKVPPDTEGYKFNVQDPEDNVTVTASAETATGWHRYYTTASPPSSFDYNGSGADHGNWKLSGTSGETTMESAATFVKWEKATVEAAEEYMLQWSVTVK